MTRAKTKSKTPKGAKQQQIRKTRKRKSKPSRGGMALGKYAAMLADPCGSLMVPGIYGTSEGLLARLKSQHRVQNLAVPTSCGYVLWCPDFTNQKDLDPALVNTDEGNLFIWQSDNPSKFPDNHDAAPFGSATGAIRSTTETLDDPAFSLLKSDIVSDARCIGACMQLTYFGTMMESAGEVGWISNLSVENVLNGGSGDNAFSVDELMNYTTKTGRFGTDTLEAVYRLNETSSEQFRSENTKLLNIPDAGTEKVTTVAMAAKTLGPRFFGFVWRNTQPDAGLTLSFTKSIEWRPEAASGLTQPPITTFGPSRVPIVNRALEQVNKTHPVWERVKSGAAGIASKISNSAFTGVQNAVVDKGLKTFEKMAMDALGDIGIGALAIL